MAFETGDVVGDYKVIELAGSGGMGAVYKIEHLITKRIEAMKVLPVGIGSGPEQVRRFEREIQVQARLHHPNIAALYNAVRDGRWIALIMEYVEGECLQRLLERGSLPLRTSVEYAGQVLDALAYAHHMGVVHRDVTPANIIITPAGAAKLTDFGLAGAATLPATGTAAGSPWYMSPEQVRAVGELDARTDIYAMGAVLREMLTGRKLFDADGSFAVMRAQLEAVPQPASAHNPEVPGALDEVVAKALAKDPAARFQSAAEFHLALDAAIGGIRHSACASNREPALKRLKGFSVPAFGAALWLGRARPSRAGILLTLASAALVAVVCAAVWRPEAASVAAQPPAPREAVLSKPAEVMPAAVPAPPGAPAEIPAPEVSVESAKPLPRRAVSSAPSKQRAGQPGRSFATRVSGGVVGPAATTPPPNAAPGMWAGPDETSALKPDEADLPETPLVGAESNASTGPETSAEPEAATQEAKPRKTGNRFIRALGKLNPFRRGAKNDSPDPVEPSAKKD